MQEKPSIESLVSTLEDLIGLLLAHEGGSFPQDLSFPETYAQLHELKKAVYAIEREQSELIAQLPPERTVPKESHPLQEKLSSLCDVCLSARQRARDILDKHQDLVENMENSLLSTSDRTERRKNKFLSIGGRKGWISM